MSKGPFGYGRYDDDPEHVGCPRAKTDMTPCIARDGHLALADDGVCVGCGERPHTLIKELTQATSAVAGQRGTWPERADRLRDLVWAATSNQDDAPAKKPSE